MLLKNQFISITTYDIKKYVRRKRGGGQDWLRMKKRATHLQIQTKTEKIFERTWLF